MEIKTLSDIKVSVFEDNNSKVIAFDRPVKQIELSSNESSRIGLSLIGNKATGITAELRELLREGYFKETRRFRAIREELAKRELVVKPPSLHVVITKMVENQELSRNGDIKNYEYLEPKEV